MSNNLHPSAIISPKAQLGDGNHVGPFVVIEDDVVIGDGNTFMTGAVIKDGSRIGDNNLLHEYAVIAGTPQDLGYQDMVSYAQIGSGNVLREHITIHRASKEHETTVAGNNNYLMAAAHIAHDCRCGNNVIMANGAALAGHVSVEDRAFISGGVMVHQFTSVGTLAMIGGNSKITQDVLPYTITDGVPGRVRGLNLVGLKRAGLKHDDIRALKSAYQQLLRSDEPLQDIIIKLREMGSPYATHLADFVSASKRGFHREVTD